MAIYHVDFGVDGNDANTGLNPLLPKKSLTSASTGRVAGDEIRVKATPKSLVGDCSWFNHQRRVGLPAGTVRLLTDGNETWVNSANVTCSNAANTQPSPGANYALITPAAGFTTGKMAYTVLGAAVNLAAFQQLTIKLLVNGTTPTNHLAGVFRVDLCSDALGNVPVNQFTLPAFGNPAWQGLLVDATVALGASIQSISLHALSDPVTSGVRIAQIAVCKAPSAADCVSHRSVISIATALEPWYYSIDFFRTEVGVDYAYIGVSDGQASDVLGNWWDGITGTYPTYVVTPPLYTTGAVSILSANQLQVFGASGTAGNKIVVSGGWNSTFTAQLAGEISWIDAINGVGYFFVFTNRNGLDVSRIGVAHGGGGFYWLGVKNSIFQDLYCTGGNQDRSCFEATGNSGSTNDFCHDLILRRLYGSLSRSIFLISRADHILMEDCHGTNCQPIYGTAIIRSSMFLNTVLRNITIKDCRFRSSALAGLTYGFNTPICDNVRFIDCTFDGSLYGAYLTVQTGGGDQDIQFIECTYANISIATHFSSQEQNYKCTDFHRCTSDAPLRVAAWPSTGTFWPSWATQEITFTAVGGNEAVNYSESPLYRMYTSAAGSRLPNGLEWRVQLLSTTAFAPDITGARTSFVRYPVLDYIWCIAGQPVTYTLYVKRNSSSVFCGLYIPPLYGGDSVLTEAATVGGWVALTVNFTPTITGAIIPEFWVWGSALDYASYADDRVQQ